MDKKDPPNTDGLTAFRSQIDEIDDQLMQLFKQRIDIVLQIGAMKHKANPGQCPIRPGREADMVRRVIESFSGTAFSPAAAASIWRLLIGASTSAESPLTIAVFTPEKDESLYWIAREYFGSVVTIIKHPLVKRVIGDVMDGTASVGIVPLLRSDGSYWWTNLVQHGKDMPKVFAQVPFVNLDVPGKDAPAGLAISRVAPEKSSDDMSLFVLQTDHNVSQSRLQTLFKQAQIEASWLDIASLSPSARHHLIAIKGFVTLDQEPLKTILNGLGADLIQATFLGAYAVPVIIKDSRKEVAHAVASNA